MATFTMELREAIEATGGRVERTGAISQLVGGDIGLQHYPIFDEAYRSTLTGKIVDHYLVREIGHESIDHFQLAMRRRMNEIMPYYNKLYESEKIKFDPLSTVNLTTLATGEAEQNATGTTESASTTQTGSESKSINSTFPMQQISPNGLYGDSGGHAESSSDADGTSSDVSESETKNVTSSESTTSGYQGAASELLNAYRATLMNIDMMVIEALSDLFMQIMGNSDSYYGRNYFGY